MKNVKDKTLEIKKSPLASSPHLAVGRVLPELMRASKGCGNNVEVGEHHALWLSQQGVAKSSESV